MEFILNNSASFRKINTSDLDEWIIKYQRFNICFQNLYELNYTSDNNFQLLDKLASTCENIHVLKIRLNSLYIDQNLINLIKNQKILESKNM